MKKADRRSRLDEKRSAVSIELTSADLPQVDAAAAQITIAGACYPEALETLTGR